jgi:hypothetical protein
VIVPSREMTMEFWLAPPFRGSTWNRDLCSNEAQERSCRTLCRYVLKRGSDAITGLDPGVTLRQI